MDDDPRVGIDEAIRPHLTRERALEVRGWRCGPDGYTWRGVAAQAYETWGHPDWLVSGHQLYGESLCRQSAILLGEDPNDDPWN